MLTKDTLLTAVLAASGGKQVIKYDDKGKPSVMVRIPKFNLEDISSALGSGPHPAFIVDGQEKSEIYIGAYPAVVDEGRACSLPGVSPTASITFDNAKAACVNKGPGWHLMTAWERAAVVLWCLKNGFQPRGNTSGGKSHEATWETGTPAPDNAVKTLGGSGPASWRHDGTMAGIADLVGNVYEWLDGLKSIDGRLYFPADNDFMLPEAQWPASSIYLDATAGPGDRNGAVNSGDVVVSDRITKYSETPAPAGGGDSGDFDYAQNTWKSTAVSSTFGNLALDKRQAAAQLMIAPKLLAADETALFPEAKGEFYSRNYGERLPYWGGNWVDGSYAGLAYLSLFHRRSYLSNRGLRPAFIL
jgi:hypothetical protein